MMQQAEKAETQIKAVIEAWADAVRRHDFSGILAHHEEDIVMFDVPPPLQSRGMEEYKKTWDLSLDTTSRHKRSTPKTLQLLPARMLPSPSQSCGVAPPHPVVLQRKAGSCSGSQSDCATSMATGVSRTSTTLCRR